MHPLSPSPSAPRLWGKRALKGVVAGAALVVLGLMAFEAARPGPTLALMLHYLVYGCEAETAEEFRDIVAEEWTAPQDEDLQPWVKIELDEWLQSVLAGERRRQRGGRGTAELVNLCLCPQEIVFVENLEMLAYSREHGRLVQAHRMTDFGAYCDRESPVVTFGELDESVPCDCRVIHPGAITEDVLVEYRHDRDVDHLWRSLLLRSVPKEPLTPRVFKWW
jgi:hypothetical protein